MKSKIIWVAMSCLMVATLLLMSCGTAEEEEEVTPPPAEEEEEPAPSEEEQPSQPEEEEADTVKWRGTRADGTVVEKLLEKPKYGGVLTQVLTSSPTGFDEVYGSPSFPPTAHLTNEEMLEGDWTKGPTGTGETTWRQHMFPAPFTHTGCLAESWERPDENTIVFHIRKGVHFHNKPPTNGREMTADDVVFSFNRLWDTPTCYMYMAYPRQTHFESITAPDKWTVVIKCLPGKTGLVWEMVADHAKVVPPEVVQQYGDMNNWEVACGTGPFILTDYVPGSAATFERNNNYWMKDPFFPGNTLPYLDGVKWLIISDVSTMLSAMRTGKIDLLCQYHGALAWEDAESLIKTNPELKYAKYFGGVAPCLHGRHDTAPFDDKRVRQALALAIDNKAIAESYYGGNAEILCGPIAPMVEFEDIYTPLEELPQTTRELFEYHPDKAKQLLTEAGYPDGFKTEIVCLTSDIDMLSIVKDYWAKIGVELDIQVKEPAVWVSMLQQKKYQQMISFAVTYTLPFKFVFTRPGNMYNGSIVNDPQLNEVMTEVDASYFDEAKRRQLMKDIAPYMIESCYWVQLPGPYLYTFWWPWVKGYNGEAKVGYDHYSDIARYIWVDQDLKEKMIGKR